MAAGRLPTPGTQYGPCDDSACGHRDCEATRNDAHALCRLCLAEIGYEVRMYADPENPKALVHADCLEGWADSQRPQ